MNSTRIRWMLVCGTVVTMAFSACKKQNTTTERPPEAATRESDEDSAQPRHPATSAAEPDDDLDGAGHRTPSSSDNKLELTGLTMSVPATWVRQTVQPGPFAAKAAFRIPGDDPSMAGIVRITHYPNMRGKNDLNIQRWLGQVTQPDGSTSSREDAKITTERNGDVSLTVVDLSGNVKSTMRAQPKPNQRMIAAILDHGQGPHFVVITGDVSLLTKHEDEVYGFFRSARPQ